MRGPEDARQAYQVQSPRQRVRCTELDSWCLRRERTSRGFHGVFAPGARLRPGLLPQAGAEPEEMRLSFAATLRPPQPAACGPLFHYMRFASMKGIAKKTGMYGIVFIMFFPP